jgi:antirestriction protein ArdC
MPKLDAYQVVTDKIVAQLEKGVVPWTKPWDAAVGMPRNLDGRPYRGINILLLGCEGYDDPRWGTFKAISDKGGKVKKGEKGSLVVFFKMLESKKEVDAKGKPKKIPMLRYFYVFNVRQTEGLELEPMTEGLGYLEDRSCEERGDSVLDGYVDAPAYKIDSIAASYNPQLDEVRMPEPERFNTLEDYYRAQFHELIHSTGHSKRLAREDLAAGRFGSQTYSREELVAEIGSAMVCAKVGIAPDVENSAAYIASWLKALGNDKKLVVTAANRATHAAEYILEGPKTDEG